MTVTRGCVRSSLEGEEPGEAESGGGGSNQVLALLRPTQESHYATHGPEHGLGFSFSLL